MATVNENTTHNTPKQFLGLLSTSFQDLLKIYMESRLRGSAPENDTDTLSSIASYLSLHCSITQEIAANLAPKFIPLLTRAAAAEFYDTSDICVLSQNDYSVITSYAADISAKYTTKAQDLTRLLIALVLYARQHPHPSNWIRYDQKEIFYLASISSLSSKQQQELTAIIHSHYGMSMRVIGSNNPIPCFNLSWMATEPVADLADSTNIELNQYCPETVSLLASTLLNTAN